MFIRSLFLALVLTVPALSVAYAKPAVASTKEEGKLVRPLLYAFVDFNWKVFGDLVADDFIPNKLDLMRKASESFYKGKPLNLDVLSGEIKDAEGKKVVSFKWQKSVMDGATGKMLNKEGAVEFVFVNRKGAWLLLQINGESPF